MQHPLYPTLDLQKTLSSSRLVGLWQLLTGFRWPYLGAVLSMSLATIARTLIYLLLAYVVDTLLMGNTSNVMMFVAVGLGFIVLAVVEGTFTYLRGRLAARTSEGVVLRLRNYLYDHIQRLPFSYHDRMPTGELIQRCSSDVDTIRQFYGQDAIALGRIVMMLVINFAAIMYLNTTLAWLAVVSMPLVVALSVYFFRRIDTAYEAHQKQEGILSTTVQENLSGVRVVKAFARQQFEIDKFQKENATQFKLGKVLITLHGFYWPLNETISLFQILLVYVAGGLMVIDGQITIGVYLAVAGLVITLIEPISGLGRLIVQTSVSLVSYSRVAEIIQAERETLDDDPVLAANPIKGQVEFRNVSFGFDDDSPVLQDISFTVEPGQTIALIGPTGSGKSSLVNLLPRFYDYNSGSILIDGKELRDYATHTLRQQIGIVEQEPFLFSRSIRENIAYGIEHEVSDAEVEAAAKAAAIHEVIMTFPDGYQTIIGEKGVTLSGGQKQRVAIARTLLKNPPLLILDDAVSAVDTETEALIHAALENLRQRRTTFIIAHRIQTVMRADQIIVLDGGKIVQRGTHEALMAQPGIYRRIYEVQARVEQDY